MALSAKDVAREFDCTPRELRKFLRSAQMGVGQGSRYEFDKRDVARMRKQFAAWSAKRKANKTTKDIDIADVPEAGDFS